MRYPVSLCFHLSTCDGDWNLPLAIVYVAGTELVSRLSTYGA